ncbi:hypothetical protein BC939DRAFT_453269 [Gamsiella multidivaricata]|uniref:uncharacterized protein n=1 Tax=Gamsiella multidivaricata TaxID=101098 RepID=UPI00221F66C6|nr:uncharacterized protein BC939DRAFT_453269 [Gamsiella multidivaricata]KAI7822669.1 hypothetical protein BC939DRAFT_453269 [Gamsiella multidivaricata]
MVIYKHSSLGSPQCFCILSSPLLKHSFSLPASLPSKTSIHTSTTPFYLKPLAHFIDIS